MKHKIRINGEVKEMDFELGSGIVDKNGKEIFEGDKVKIGNKTYKVICGLGYGLCLEDYKRMCQELRTQARFDHDKGYAFSLEIVGRVND